MTRCGNFTKLVTQLRADLDAVIPPLQDAIADYLWPEDACTQISWVKGLKIELSFTFLCGCKVGVYGHCFEFKEGNRIEVLEFQKRNKQGGLVFRDVKYDTLVCLHTSGYRDLHARPMSWIAGEHRKVWYTQVNWFLGLHGL